MKMGSGVSHGAAGRDTVMCRSLILASKSQAIVHKAPQLEPDRVLADPLLYAEVVVLALLR